MSKSPLSMPSPGRLTSSQGDQRHSSWQTGVVKVVTVDVVKVEVGAGVFTDGMLLIVDEGLLGDPEYTTVGVGMARVLEGRIEVMTVDKGNRSEPWALGLSTWSMGTPSLLMHQQPCGSHHRGHTNFEN